MLARGRGLVQPVRSINTRSINGMCPGASFDATGRQQGPVKASMYLKGLPRLHMAVGCASVARVKTGQFCCVYLDKRIRADVAWFRTMITRFLFLHVRVSITRSVVGLPMSVPPRRAGSGRRVQQGPHCKPASIWYGATHETIALHGSWQLRAPAH